ncbi:transmembrane 9 superfamily member 2 isoform X1 [Daphnia magna]|nr:transmembrane 9 superfamily member 2 isoform X1 [Daphnia magna]
MTLSIRTSVRPVKCQKFAMPTKQIVSSFLLLIHFSHGFYIPWLAPVNYCTKDKQSDTCKNDVSVFVNRLNSEEAIIPYEYHHFDFCTDDHETGPVENLGQVVFGERIRSSPYKLEFKNNQEWDYTCKKSYQPGNQEDLKKIKELIHGISLNYQHHWIVDNMPVTWCYQGEPGQQFCSTGFPMGCYLPKSGKPKDACVMNPAFNKPDTYYIFNHIDLTIIYHGGKGETWSTELDDDIGRILSVKVGLRSLSVEKDPTSPPMIVPKELKEPLTITYTYSVKFIDDPFTKWSSRWDFLLESMPSAQWFSILNALVIVLLLSGMVAMFLLRPLHKDIARYNQIDSGKDAQEEFGWKLVHGDIFRPPRKGMLLSVFVGSGVQVFIMTLITLIFACLGFLSPANRGALMTCALVFYVCLGTPAGYVSSRIYKSFGGERWKLNVLLTSMLCPGIVFGVFFVLNLVLWSKGSSGAISFGILAVLLALWFGISVPLTFVGAFFGFRKRPIEHPVRTNQIHRQVPDQSVYTRPASGIVMGGVLPFGCIFIQLFFILNSLWSNQMYYMFGFHFLVFIILVITCSETTVLLCYFHLCAEDYHWWWRSFLTSGFTAFYLFMYCVHYFVTKLEIQDATSTFLYFGYTFIMVFLFFLLSGTIGFFACFWFVRKIYSVVKVV